MRGGFEMIAGVVGGFLVSLFGGFDVALQALVICMIIDYIMGIFVAGVFHKSKKSEHGSLSSIAGWKGIVKKVSTIFIIVVANHIDRTLGVNYIKNAVCMGFLANEGLSILENYSLMGGSGASALQKALDVLKSKKSE